MRLQFPFYKLFLIVAAFAVAFRINAETGWLGVIIAIVTGTAASGVIIGTRNFDDVVKLVYVTFGAGVGWFFSGAGSIRIRPPTFGEEIRAFAVQAVAVFIGALLISFVRKMDERLNRHWELGGQDGQAGKKSAPIQSDVQPLGRVRQSAGANSIDSSASNLADGVQVDST